MLGYILGLVFAACFIVVVIQALRTVPDSYVEKPRTDIYTYVTLPYWKVDEDGKSIR